MKIKQIKRNQTKEYKTFKANISKRTYRNELNESCLMRTPLIVLSMLCKCENCNKRHVISFTFEKKWDKHIGDITLYDCPDCIKKSKKVGE